ncbi:MAG TPA: DMT family transporter [Tardiphaga sp.]
MPTTETRMDARDWVLLIVLSVLWGGSFFFNGLALKELPPLTLVSLRVLLAAAILLSATLACGLKLPSTLRDWMPFAIIAFLNNALPFSLIVIGQTYIPSGLASVINATTPLFTVLVMAAAGDETLHARRVAGVVLGLAGVVLLRGQVVDFGVDHSIGILLCLAAALSYGFAALYARRKLLQSPPLVTAACQLMASTVMMIIVSGFAEQPWRLPIPSMTIWLAIAGLAALSTALAYVIFFQILRRSGSTNVMLVTLLVPITAILLGSLVLNETILPREIAGALVIASALMIMDGRVISVVPRWTRGRPF